MGQNSSSGNGFGGQELVSHSLRFSTRSFMAATSPKEKKSAYMRVTLSKNELPHLIAKGAT
jgi:hypothetical protein